MNAAVAHFRALGFTRCAEVEADDPARGITRVHAGLRTPLLLPGAAAAWPALARWDRDHLLARCGDVVVRPSVGLGDGGLPYADEETARRRTMSLRAFWEILEREGRCYVDQQSLAELPGLSGDVDFAALLGECVAAEVNLWIGRGTRSGMHVDSGDNFVVMVRGTKHCALAPLDDAPLLAPFSDAITKSQVDFEAPDHARFVGLGAVSLRAVTLRPGDALFIPRGWWHYLRAPGDDYQLSLNCWFGDAAAAVYLALLRHLGLGAGIRLAHDLVRYGILGRPHRRLNYRPRPDGVIVWDALRSHLDGFRQPR